MTLKDKLLKDKSIELISVTDDIEIQLDKDKTIGYDFTVEDYFTFATDDGLYVQDTMSLNHTLSNESQHDVKTKMMRGEGFAKSTATNLGISKEIGIGLYFITKDIIAKNSPFKVTQKELAIATDPYQNVIFRGRETSMGKAIFNNCFPSDFPFLDNQATNGNVNDLVSVILEKYGFEVMNNTFSNLKDIGFKFATIMAPNINIDELELPPSLIKIKEKLKTATPEEADSLMKDAMVLLKEHLKGTIIYDISDSGGAKGWGQPLQILVAKGLMADTEGNFLKPIAGSFSDGMTPGEYFNISSGSRKGVADRALNTADSGYFSRQMAYVLNSVEVDRTLKDCGTKRGLPVRINKDIMKKMMGRYYIDKNTNKSELFIASEHKEGELVIFRSPIYCESNKICHVCYGKLLEKIKTPYVGIVAGQTMGETATQTLMRTFHTGGAVDIIKRDALSDIIQNDPYIEDKKLLLKYIKQDDNFIHTQKPCKMTINLKEDYTESAQFDLDIENESLYLKALISRVEYDDKIFNIILDYAVNIKIENNGKNVINKNIIQLVFKENENIIEVLTEANILTQQLQYVKRLLGGKEIYKDANHMFMKLYNIYGKMSGMDLVHLEILLSQCFRDKENLQLPARLGKTWNPTMINIKQIVFNSSFLQGLGFENIGKSIAEGLISNEPEDPSILEKVLTGTLHDPTREELKRKERRKERLR